MSSPGEAVTVAIFNNDEFLLDAVQEGLRLAGLPSACYLIEDLKQGKADFVELIKDSRAQVVLYDIVPPFDRNWEFFMSLRRQLQAALGDMPIVITTANKTALLEVVGIEEAVEFVGKPYELAELVQIVQSLVLDRD